VPAGTVLNGMMAHMDIWPTTAAMAGLTPPYGECTSDDGKPIDFDTLGWKVY
jgi:hypothetical protein